MLQTTLFALGFRPFFLLAGWTAFLFVAFWVVAYVAGFDPDAYYGGMGWHAHEMLFGYVPAVAAGFLLTAVRNWTGRPTPTGAALAGLALLWLAGRAAPFLHGLVPAWLIAAADLAFLPVVALVLAGPVLAAGQRRNLGVVAVLLLLAAANTLVHLQALDLAVISAPVGHDLATLFLAVLIVVIGGRVIPPFTVNALPGVTCPRIGALETVAVAATVAVPAVRVLYPAPTVMAAVAAVAAVSNGLRLALWFTPRIRRDPLVWVLHAGFAWVVIGLALYALAALGLFPSVLALHALTIGGVGVMTLGMMARVALGHTGRPLVVPGGMATAFVLVNLAAVARVLLPMVWPGLYRTSVILAGLLWLAAFGVFVARYSRILLTPRVDGRPG